jgi:hypothetical protein
MLRLLPILCTTLPSVTIMEWLLLLELIAVTQVEQLHRFQAVVSEP